MLPSVPILPVYKSFRQNIWHSIFDQFHFHHKFGDEMTVSSDKTGTGTSCPPFGSCCVLFLGTSWMAIRERSFKYLDAQQVSQQISIFFKSKFHNEGSVCEKKLFWVFFWQWSHSGSGDSGKGKESQWLRSPQFGDAWTQKRKEFITMLSFV